MKKYDPVSSRYLYYWSDACPRIGSGLLDYYRRPYKVYDYMQRVYTPVLVCAQPCIHPYKLGREKIFHVGMSYTARVWAINDNYESIPDVLLLSLIHISEPTRLGMISYAVFCLKKKQEEGKLLKPP